MGLAHLLESGLEKKRNVTQRSKLCLKMAQPDNNAYERMTLAEQVMVVTTVVFGNWNKLLVYPQNAKFFKTQIVK